MKNTNNNSIPLETAYHACDAIDLFTAHMLAFVDKYLADDTQTRYWQE